MPKAASSLKTEKKEPAKRAAKKGAVCSPSLAFLGHIMLIGIDGHFVDPSRPCREKGEKALVTVRILMHCVCR
jgi:hypothetical protein